MKKNNCCICDSLFQFFTCLNMFYGTSEGSDTDVFLGDVFHDKERVVKKLKEVKVFRNIYFYNEIEAEPTIFHNVFHKVQRIIKPEKYVERVVNEPLCLKEQEYTDVYISMAYRFSIATVLACPSAKVHYYDDGLGSYMGKIYEDSIDYKWKLFYGLFGVSHKRLYPDVTHVYSATLCKSEMSGEIIEISRRNYSDESYREFLRDIFQYERNIIYDYKKCVYLTKPKDFNNPKIDVLDSEIENRLLPYKEDCMLRMHPRDARTDIVPIEKDESSKLWELVCLDSIREDMQLIGWFSTAQFIPKILYDMEPVIVLTFPMYEEYFSKELLQQFMRFTEDVKGIYRDKSKIILIHNVEEFEQYLKQACKKIS